MAQRKVFYQEGENNLWFPEEYRKAVSKLRIIAVGQERYADMLEQVPHVLCCDLAILILYYPGKDLFGDRAAVVGHRQREKWGRSVAQLCKDAAASCAKALPARLECLGDILGGRGKEPSETTQSHAGQEPMVLSNTICRFGAASIFYPGMQQEAAAKLGGSYYVLPSSLHELILLRDDRLTNPESLKEIVLDVNHREVAEEDILTDSVYHYDAVLRKFHRVA